MGRLLSSLISYSPMKCWFGNSCIKTYIALSSQMSHCMVPILLYLAGKWPKFFFFDDAWASKTLASAADFIVICSLFLNGNNSRSWEIYLSCSFRDSCSESSGPYNIFFIKFVQICSLSHHMFCKGKNNSLPFPAALEYHSHLIMCPQFQPRPVHWKMGDCHNVFDRRCIWIFMYTVTSN